MTLNSKRILLSPIDATDLEALFDLQSIEAVARYNTIGIPEEKEFTNTLIQNALQDKGFNQTNFWWSIRLRATNVFIGEAGLNLNITKYKSAEIFYSLHPSYWKKGLATEAVETILNFGFVDLNLHRITAGVATANQASIRLLERVGMIREGMHRKILPIRGEWWDNYHYAILEEDFFTKEL